MIGMYEAKLNHKKGQKASVENRLKTLNQEINDLSTQLLSVEAAQFHIQTVAKKVQESFKVKIESIVSVALSSVFDDPYEFKVDFEIKRNRTECILSFERNGFKVNPLNASGGGAVDIASFALRLSLWSLENPKKESIIILDEPFKFVSKNLREKASMLVKELSDKMGIQFIIVTHEDNLIDYSDKIFKVTQNKKGISTVKEEK